MNDIVDILKNASPVVAITLIFAYIIITERRESDKAHNEKGRWMMEQLELRDKKFMEFINKYLKK